MFTLTLVDLEY